MNECLATLISILLSATGSNVEKQLFDPDDFEQDPSPLPSYAPPPSANHAPSEPSEGTADRVDGLTWNCSDPDGDSIVFDLYFGNAESDLIYICTLCDAAFAWPGTGISLRPGEYLWRIDARDSQDQVTEGPIWSFSVLESGEFSTLEEESLFTQFTLPAEDTEPEPGTLSQGPLAGMTFAWIPSGSFEMGSSSDPVSSPVHTVQIRGFEMMTTEITQGLWEYLLDENPSRWKNANRPVERVSWDDCQVFISTLNEYDTHYIYRLPTESEWEYACRAGTTTRYFWGSTFCSEYCRYYDNTRVVMSGGPDYNISYSVMSVSSNPWGLYDMSGNVWEWCEDIYQDNYYGEPPLDGSAWITLSNNQRVVRGGAYKCNEWYVQSSSRSGHDQNDESDDIGFRLVRTIR